MCFAAHRPFHPYDDYRPSSTSSTIVVREPRLRAIGSSRPYEPTFQTISQAGMDRAGGARGRCCKTGDSPELVRDLGSETL